MTFMPASVKAELKFTEDITEGTTGMRARRVQEWLCFANFATAIDASFGPATTQVVKSFQKARDLPANGIVNRATWNALTSPLVQVCSTSVPASTSRDVAMLRVTKSHLAIHPIELGGKNRGPWVRTYCGADGDNYLWCAGFVTFVMKQACSLIGVSNPLPGTLSCDSLAAQAKERNRFIRGRNLQTGTTKWEELGQCQLFLKRRTASDWTHTGFSFEGVGETFKTIEGNASESGIPGSGFEVCTRVLGIANQDFVFLS